MKMSKTILITGASGFIGSFLCEEAVNRGYETWAALRSSSSKKWLTQKELRFITLDFTDKNRLKNELKQAGVKFDVVIHAGGATKCLHREDFVRHNFLPTRNLVEALSELNMMPSQFIYLSSLSAIYGSAYGESKLMTEKWLQEQTDVFKSPCVIFRPTGVYGPRERDYFMMVKSIKQHVDFAVGYSPQRLTFVYVKDLVGAIFAAIDRNIHGGIFNITDGQSYSSREFSNLIQAELGVKHVVHITSPLWVLKVVSVVAEALSKITGRPSTLNKDKYKIMAQRDWTCDTTPMTEVLNYTPQWQLPRGVKETIRWYKQENWI